MIASGIRLVLTALGQYGQAEVSGPQANPAIVAYLRSVGLGPSDETAWCSAFMFWLCKMQNVERPPAAAAAAARSWLNVGVAPITPELGDVVVLQRGKESWQGHVGLFIRMTEDGKKIWVLGGNQANSVSLAEFTVARVLGYRRLK